MVHSGKEALEACQAAPPDLVLIDLVVPHGHGFDVCRRLKAQSVTRFIPVVIVTAQGDRSDRLRGIEAGCDDFLIKLWSMENYLEVLTLPSRRTQSRSVAFSADGQWLAADSADDTIQLWHAPAAR